MVLPARLVCSLIHLSDLSAAPTDVVFFSAFHYLLPPIRTRLECRVFTQGTSTCSLRIMGLCLRPPSLSIVRVRISPILKLYSMNPDSVCGPECHTRYHHSYYLHDEESRRTYYLEKPQFVQATLHSFVDRDTCELFSSMMVSAWYVYCGRVYWA